MNKWTGALEIIYDQTEKSYSEIDVNDSMVFIYISEASVQIFRCNFKRKQTDIIYLYLAEVQNVLYVKYLVQFDANNARIVSRDTIYFASRFLWDADFLSCVSNPKTNLVYIASFCLIHHKIWLCFLLFSHFTFYSCNVR